MLPYRSAPFSFHENGAIFKYLNIKYSSFSRSENEAEPTISVLCLVPIHLRRTLPRVTRYRSSQFSVFNFQFSKKEFRLNHWKL